MSCVNPRWSPPPGIQTQRLFQPSATPTSTVSLTTWQTPWNIDVTATWRYYGTVANINGASGNILDDSLDSANYLDLAAQYYIRENVTLRAGVQNVFGRDQTVGARAKDNHLGIVLNRFGDRR